MQYEARIQAHSVNHLGEELVSFLLTYPRFVHSELMTHRAFSRNAASSRAIPTAKLRAMIKANPAMPVYYGLNQPGMAADAEVSPEAKAAGIKAIDELREHALAVHQQLDELGWHKQTANRYIEPWMWIQVLVTTGRRGLMNFFALRCERGAQPEIQKIADMALDRYVHSTPKLVEPEAYHLPFAIDDCTLVGLQVAVARAARLSGFQFDGSFSIEKDQALAAQLAANGHWSPFEHVAQALMVPMLDTSASGNLGCQGWIQYRKEFLGECRIVPKPAELLAKRLRESKYH